MDKEVMGVVVAVSKQWWLKVNTKSVRTNALDGAIFPHIIKVTYVVDGKEYTKRKWIGAGYAVPFVGDELPVRYCSANPKKAEIPHTSIQLQAHEPVKHNDSKEDKTLYLPICMSIGLSIGMAIGASFGSIPTGMCIGMAVGVGVGALLDAKNRQDEDENG